MLRKLLIFLNLCWLAFFIYVIVNEIRGKTDSSTAGWIFIIIALTYILLTLTYFFRTRSEDSLIGLWIESKKKKLRKEMGDLEKKD